MNPYLHLRPVIKWEALVVLLVLPVILTLVAIAFDVSTHDQPHEQGWE